MDKRWAETLTQLGATISDDQQLEYPSTDRNTCIIPLVHQQLISVIGEQAHDFLQGQLSCDMQTVLQQGSGLGAHCNIKGSMVALYRLFHVDNGYFLRVSHDLSKAAKANLDKYIIFSKAETTDLSQSHVGLGLLGPGATTLIERIFERSPSEINSIIHSAEMLATKLAEDRYELWLPLQQAIDLLPSLLEETTLASTDRWKLADIQAGIPSITAATSESFIPQMTNLQAVDGVSFRKGCYTGQEIITRLQHRGKLTKPMYRLSISGDTARPEVGDYLDADNRSKVGQIIAVASNDDQFELLAVINKAVADSAQLYLANNSEVKATILPLPYELDPELFERKN